VILVTGPPPSFCPVDGSGIPFPRVYTLSRQLHILVPHALLLLFSDLRNAELVEVSQTIGGAMGVSSPKDPILFRPPQHPGLHLFPKETLKPPCDLLTTPRQRAVLVANRLGFKRRS